LGEGVGGLLSESESDWIVQPRNCGKNGEARGEVSKKEEVEEHYRVRTITVHERRRRGTA